MKKDLNALLLARTVIAMEIESLERMSRLLDENFENAISVINRRRGRVIIIGMGKSGIVGRKIAATMASTGTSAFFVHPAEAFHGDLGMIKNDDVVILISNSGETEEIIKLIPFLEWQKNKIIAMTGNMQSSLARHACTVLDISVEREACNNNLAPTCSTTAALVMGDALAVSLSVINDFQPSDFARFHPGGNLGRKLLTRVLDVMHRKNLPICSPESEFRDVVNIITTGRLGLAVVLQNGSLVGLITDGDLRRAFQEHIEPTKLKAGDFMTKEPKTISENELFSKAEEKMRLEKISSLIVMRENSSVMLGVLNIYDV